ncbi:unnamed protein product [Moneuplotes crassus]|uniref:Uncharacterized protein n=1 Tax=Euplotes crassus TaxID=5936 RepID=A0AAD1XQR2_EUPCR|nr:unnamed protein product [Moneuplotes crassus]
MKPFKRYTQKGGKKLNQNKSDVIKPNNLKLKEICTNFVPTPRKTGLEQFHNHYPISTNNNLSHINMSSMLDCSTSKYSQLINRKVPSRRSRISQDSRIQNYNNVSSIMNYKGNSLDCSDIEGARAGSGADGIFKYRASPLNPLNPQYTYPGEAEVKQLINRRQRLLKGSLLKRSQISNFPLSSTLHHPLNPLKQVPIPQSPCQLPQPKPLNKSNSVSFLHNHPYFQPSNS